MVYVSCQRVSSVCARLVSCSVVLYIHMQGMNTNMRACRLSLVRAKVQIQKTWRLLLSMRLVGAEAATPLIYIPV